MQGLVLVLCAMLIGGFVSESAASDAAAAPENQPAVTTDPAQKVRTAAFVIAAADSPDHLKVQADFVCPGTNDHTVINAAIAALPEPGGRVHLSAGNYSIGGVEGTYGGINILRSNVLLTGEGSGTRLTLQSGLADVNVIWINGDICDVAVRDLYINGNGKQQIRNREKGWQGCNGIKAIDRGLGPSPRNIRVENCHIENCRLMAVMLTGDMVEVVNCYFTGDFGSHVIEILGRSGRIEGCTMWVRKGDVVGYGWATDACDYYHIVNNKIFVEEGGTISSHIFNNWAPFQYGGGSRTNLYHGIISGNIFVNNGKAGSVWLRGYVDVINNNIFRGVTVELGAQHIPEKLIGGGMWLNFEHNMLVNSVLAVNSLDDNEEYFTFINGNSFVNSPVNYKKGKVIWGKNPGYVTENSGVAAIAGDQTQIVVAHGLAAAAHTVHVTPAANLGQATKFWVDEIGEREFTIKLDAAPGVDTPFHWRAVIADKL
ncbi:MAG: hypothetical protein ACOYCD_07850 [Kiritimatiellia bacterium]|jgi:hypothetical protein